MNTSGESAAASVSLLSHGKKFARGGHKTLSAARDGRNQHHFVAILKRVGLAAEEADVFVVYVDVDEAAKLALLILDLGGERREVLVDIGDQRQADWPRRR